MKILGPVMNVTTHAAAHAHMKDKVHIYSESYGPIDNGKIVSRYQPDTLMAIRKGVKEGEKMFEFLTHIFGQPHAQDVYLYRSVLWMSSGFLKIEHTGNEFGFRDLLFHIPF